MSGGIDHGMKTPWVIIQGNMAAVRYRNQVLQLHAVHVVQQHQLTLQRNNARPHVTRICRDFLVATNVPTLDWPPYSPDISPIEHLRDELDRRVRKRPNLQNNVAQLTLSLTDEWRVDAPTNCTQNNNSAMIMAR